MRRSQLTNGEMVKTCSSDARRHLLSLVVRTILAGVSMFVLVYPIFAAAQDQGQQLQGPAASAASDEALKERVKSLEQTVEDLKGWREHRQA